MTRPLANITREVLEPVWMRHDIPTKVIASRLGVTRQGLSYKARSLGLPSRAKNRRKHVDDETFTKMWLAGVSTAEMAEAFGYCGRAAIGTRRRLLGLVEPDDVARTLSARYYKDGSEILVSRGKGRNPRRLTPRECARLMGFEKPGRADFVIPVSDTQAY